MAWVSEFLYKELKNLKKKGKKYIFFCFLCWMEGGRGSDFFYNESKSTQFVSLFVCLFFFLFFFFGGGGGWNRRGSVARG